MEPPEPCPWLTPKAETPARGLSLKPIPSMDIDAFTERPLSIGDTAAHQRQGLGTRGAYGLAVVEKHK